MSGKKISLAVLVSLFLFSFFVAVPLRLYHSFAMLDVVLHFLGGLFIALLVLSYYNSEFKKLSQPFKLFALLGLVAGIGVMWEFFEYILAVYFSESTSNYLGFRVSFQGNMDDTMQDFLMDFFGGALGGFLSILRKK
jgi:hypothetical protein